jgi:hypothetical protein
MGLTGGETPLDNSATACFLPRSIRDNDSEPCFLYKGLSFLTIQSSIACLCLNQINFGGVFLV